MISVLLPNNRVVTIAYRPLWVDRWVPDDVYVTIKDIIYVSQKVSLTSIPLTILYHELMHIDQQKSDGLVSWLLLYLLSKKFRLSQEAQAYAFEISKMTSVESKKQRLIDAATWLSGPEYRYCAKSFEQALSEIRKYCSYSDFI